ncbi:MAG: hypothetical protein J6W88_01705 [Bacteroidales bacterium]|nr:hypothetical protein [Bacteroidales bacterium]
MRHTVKILVAAVAVVLFASCAKERQCKCVYTENDDTKLKIFVVDRSLKCSSITEVAEEEKYNDPNTGEHGLVRTEVHKVSCRDYDEN